MTDNSAFNGVGPPTGDGDYMGYDNYNNSTPEYPAYDDSTGNYDSPASRMADQPIRTPLQLQDGTDLTPMNGSVSMASSQNSLNFPRDASRYKSLDRKKRYAGEPNIAPGHSTLVRRDSWDSTIKQSSTGPPSPSRNVEGRAVSFAQKTSNVSRSLSTLPKPLHSSRRDSWDGTIKLTPGGEEPSPTSSRVSYPQAYPNDVHVSYRPDGSKQPSLMTPSVSTSTVAKSTADLVKSDQKKDNLPKCFSKVKEFFTQSKYEKPRTAFLIILLVVIVLCLIVVPVVYHQQKTAGNKRKTKESPWQFGIPVVTIGCGVTITGREENNHFIYKGVPYAKPPTQNLRWQPPEPMLTNEDCHNVFGSYEYSAKDFRSRCPQLKDDKVVGTEDCLFVNIWTPKDNVTNHPVLVWIHGGDLTSGGGDELGRFTLKNLVDEHVVIVSINYRLNVFGYLAVSALSQPSGNYGLKDQIMALKWVKKNIPAFRGDPNKVTVAGVGSGGTSILALIASPSAAGLFHRAWIMSGGLISERSAQQVMTDNERFVQKVGCSSGTAEEVRKCLYNLHEDTILNNAPFVEFPSWNKKWKFDFPTVGVTSGAMIYIDNDTLPSSPIKLIQSGKANKVTLVVGNNLNEADLNPPYFRTTPTLTPTEDTKFESQVSAFKVSFAGKDLLNVDIKSEAGFTALVSYVRAICPYNEIVKAYGGIPEGMPVYRYLVTAKPTTPIDPFNNSFKAKYAFHKQDYLALFGGVKNEYANAYAADTNFGENLQKALVRIIYNGFISNWMMTPSHVIVDTNLITQHRDIAQYDSLSKICNSLEEVYGWWPDYAWVN